MLYNRLSGLWLNRLSRLCVQELLWNCSCNRPGKLFTPFSLANQFMFSSYYPNDMSNMSIPSDPVPTVGRGCYTQPLLSVESSVSFFKGPVASHMALTSVFSNRKPKPTHENQHLLIARNNVYFKAIKAAWEWNTSQYTEPSNKHKLSINATISNDATLELMQE
ncbi:hypothetical protein F2Q70_00004441 [Brassica cretica]|uniref:Uncharacterized protein n=1 Tax=Brassica cretica TaxID=69181 RepID=A0A8S9IZJ7_BRACR|nr:hypothetical protein F2Q70_00004441 [Brassica cretica]